MSETTTEQSKGSSGTMTKLVLELVRPYRGWLIVVIDRDAGRDRDEHGRAMAAQGRHRQRARPPPSAGLAALGPRSAHWPRARWASRASPPSPLILIAVIGGVATYIDNYYTESVGQWVANDLRVRIFDHLQRLSLGYYDKQQTGVLLSTITNDVTTLQNFASSATLGILDRSPDDRRCHRPHVLAQLGLRADRRRRDAVSAVLRRPLQKGRQEGTAPGPPATGRHRHRRPGGARVGARRQSIRPAGSRAGAAWRGQPGDRRGRAQGAEGEVAALAHWWRSWSRRARRSCSGAVRR